MPAPDRPGSWGRPAPEAPAPIQGHDAKVKPRGHNPAEAASVKHLDAATWPSGGMTEITLPHGSGRSPARGHAGGLPIAVSPSKASAAKANPGGGGHGENMPARVRVTALGRSEAVKLGVAEVLDVQRADGVHKPGSISLTVDYSKFAEAYGGDYGSRLRLVELPKCASRAKPGSKECPELPTPLASANDSQHHTVTAKVAAGPAATGLTPQAAESASLVALTAGASSDKGDYKATKLAPSASWNVSNSSGGFSWSYPFRTVPTPGGLTPSIGLSYSSQSVDGRTAVTNNQGSWIGGGFSFEPGYIERRYKPCSDDGHDGSAEQCWAYDNATILLNGTSTQLIKDDATGEWHMATESGARIEKLTGTQNGDDNGEYWRVTTTDGTEYYFGKNRLPGWTDGDEETNSTWTTPVFGDDSGEPCYDATFSRAHCDQAWRWNLDYVKDTHGNVMSYFYGTEVNHYALNGKTDVDGTAYIRGGYLKHIDYGQRDGSVYDTKAPARVEFTVAERCLPTDTFDCATSKRTVANAAYWPDVPVDLECKAATHCDTSQSAASFWTTKRLTAVTTQMLDGDAYQDVDKWTLTQTFEDNGDDSKTLWLSKIGHTGEVGDSISLPSVELQGMQFPNRVDKDGDNIGPFNRFRLTTVLSETGARLDITYAPTECTADALPKPGESTKRCYPVKWTPPGHVDPITDWFHKYVVQETTQTDRTGGADDLVTRYDYQGAAAWRHAEPDGITDEADLTWSQWQGYSKVTVTSGNGETMPTRVDYTYLQGMDGDEDPAGGTRDVTVTDSTGTQYTDHKEYSGFQLEAATYDDGALVSKVISEPWKHDTATQTKPWATTKATMVKTKVTRGYKKLSNGTWRETKSESTYDTASDTGRLLRTNDLGDLATATDDKCTRLWYADNPGLYIYDLPSRSEAVSVDCATTPDRTTQVIADERTFYDGGGFDDPPVNGDATTTQRMTSNDGTTPTYQVSGTTKYDKFGRATAQTDAKGATTTTAYTDVDGLISQTKVTNALGHITTTDYAPAWGQSRGQTDPNGKRTDLAYDALGRLVSVWLPDRAKSQTPSIKYTYLVRKDQIVAVKTQKIEISGAYGTEYQLYDSLLRPRQIQTQGPDGSRLVADTFYDGTGKVKKVNKTYNAAGAPSDQLLLADEADVNGQVEYQRDGLGRTTAEIFDVAGVEQWRTTTTYDGEKTLVDPPVGGVPTTTITNAAGQTLELRHWKGDAPNPAGAEGPGLGYDATKYTYTPAGQLETVTDSAGNVWQYKYDQLGRKVKSVDPDSGTMTTSYDADDRPLATTDARGETVSTVYDKLGRVTSTWKGEPNTGTKLTETFYDKAGWLGKAWATKRYVDGGSAYFATVTQAMDDFYRPLKTLYSIPASEGALAGNYIFTKTYNRDDTLAGIGMPAAGGLNSESITFHYDELQRPISMDGKDSYVAGTTYSPLSKLWQLQLGTATGKKVLETFRYEKGTDRLTQSSVDIEGRTGAAKFATYSYDQAGNILSIADTAGTSPDVQCFAYDTRRRLAAAWTPGADSVTAAGSGTVGSNLKGTSPLACNAAPGASSLGGPAPYWKSYTVDSIGNRTQEVTHDPGLAAAKDVTRTYTYGEGAAGPHAVTKLVENTPTGDRQSTYAYGPAGNTTARTIGGDTQILTWNAEGKLTKTTEANGQETTYVYDASGNRLLRRDAQGSTAYLPGMELHVAKGSSTAEATRFYSFAGQTVAVRSNDKKLSYLASDHQGTGQLAIDPATGAVTQRRFDPYGVPRGQSSGTWPSEKGFVGGTIDAQTGLTHLGAREYDAELGKFISVDPIIDYTDPDQINGYAYSNNSPVTNSDPSGQILSGCNAQPWLCFQNVDKPHHKHETEVNESESDVDAAQSQLDHVKHQIAQAAKGLIKIAKRELGIDAALDCFSSGDLSSCGETALNIAGSFAGGLAGKLLRKYGMPWKWAKASRLAKDVWGLGKKLINGIRGFFKASERLGKARKKLAAAREKAKAFFSKGKGCTHSFLPGTGVLLADGSVKPIEQVKIGDKVTVTDPKTGKTTTREVVGTIITKDDKEFVDLTVAKTGEKDASLIATDTHPFWSDSEHKWIKAGDLTSGVTLHTKAGARVTVEAVRHFTKRQLTRDLTINGTHTYYVLAGATPVLVHNCGGAVTGHPAACECADGGIPKVRNGKLAGDVHPKTNVPFDENGFPDFSAWRHPDVPDVRIELSGSRGTDFARSNRAAGLSETPDGYTWHHHQEPGLMQLIETEAHKRTAHTGGFSGGR
jgi:RHS repeat-associated protein